MVTCGSAGIVHRVEQTVADSPGTPAPLHRPYGISSTGTCFRCSSDTHPWNHPGTALGDRPSLTDPTPRVPLQICSVLGECSGLPVVSPAQLHLARPLHPSFLLSAPP